MKYSIHFQNLALQESECVYCIVFFIFSKRFLSIVFADFGQNSLRNYATMLQEQPKILSACFHLIRRLLERTNTFGALPLISGKVARAFSNCSIAFRASCSCSLARSLIYRLLFSNHSCLRLFFVPSSRSFEGIWWSGTLFPLARSMSLLVSSPVARSSF